MTDMPRITAGEALQTDALKNAGYSPDDESRGTSRGQILILFALFLTALVGMLGLAMDVGYAQSQRRMMQNAADLAAIAGALSVANYNPSNQVSSMTAIQNTIDGNQTHEGSPALEDCWYLNDSLYEIGACDGYVPANATGVSIDVRETHETFFIRVVPGAPTQVTTRASASARVERLFRAGMDAPFLVCGYDTKLMDGSELDILASNAFVNPDAIGETFRIMGTSSPAATAEIANCGLSGTGAANWHGLAENKSTAPNNDGKELNDYWLSRLYDTELQTKNNVTGLEGCEKLTPAPYNCVLLLPIAIDGAHGSTPINLPGANDQFMVTKVLAFEVASCGSTCYQGTLLDDYPTFGGSVEGWCRDCGAVTVIKLKE